MQTTLTQAASTERVAYHKLWRAGALVLASAVVANLVIQASAVRLFNIPDAFLPLTPGPTVFFTTTGVLGAIGAYALIGRWSRRPAWLFRRVALSVLLISLVPDLLMLLPNAPFPGTTTAGVVTLMAEHIVTWLICAEGLTRLALDTAPAGASTGADPSLV